VRAAHAAATMTVAFMAPARDPPLSPGPEGRLFSPCGPGSTSWRRPPALRRVAAGPSEEEGRVLLGRDLRIPRRLTIAQGSHRGSSLRSCRSTPRRPSWHATETWSRRQAGGDDVHDGRFRVAARGQARRRPRGPGAATAGHRARPAVAVLGTPGRMDWSSGSCERARGGDHGPGRARRARRPPLAGRRVPSRPSSRSAPPGARSFDP
jgi:hypothetical protein